MTQINADFTQISADCFLPQIYTDEHRLCFAPISLVGAGLTALARRKRGRARAYKCSGLKSETPCAI
ncbi:MAG: hypothetical protein EAZ24_08965 [Burkholderiales bacterium]|nr:MAG: hypothetical protein EAZ24_08965 [Burkholderiales bacterium]TAG79048.1 MAG: hypothetical protein EAZ21_11345 [Betaproteobacteria bacterium]